MKITGSMRQRARRKLWRWNFTGTRQPTANNRLESMHSTGAFPPPQPTARLQEFHRLSSNLKTRISLARINRMRTKDFTANYFLFIRIRYIHKQ
jgi:hypothetical protein